MWVYMHIPHTNCLTGLLLRMNGVAAPTHLLDVTGRGVGRCEAACRRPRPRAAVAAVVGSTESSFAVPNCKVLLSMNSPQDVGWHSLTCEIPVEDCCLGNGNSETEPDKLEKYFVLGAVSYIKWTVGNLPKCFTSTVVSCAQLLVCRGCIGVESFIGSRVQCVFCFEICNLEGRKVLISK